MKLEKQEEKELEMLLDEIPHATSPHPHQTHRESRGRLSIHEMYGNFPHDPSPLHASQHTHVHAHDLFRHGSTASSSLSATPPSLSTTPPSPIGGDDIYRFSSESAAHAQERLMAEIDVLQRELQTIRISENRDSAIRRSTPGATPVFGNNQFDRYGFQGNRGNVEESRRSVLPNPVLFDEERRSRTVYGLRKQYYVGADLSDSSLSSRQLDSASLYPGGFCAEPVDSLYRENVLGSLRNSCHRGIPDVVSSTNKAMLAQSFLQSKQNGVGSDKYLDVLNSPNSPYLDVLNSPNSPRSVFPKLHNSSPATNGRAGAFVGSWATPQPPSSMKNLRNIEAFGCEDSFIIQGKRLSYVVPGRDVSREQKRSQANDCLDSRGIPVLNIDSVPRPRPSPILPLKFDNLLEAEDYIYYIAKDQLGCRLLQRKFEEGKPQDVEIIFNGVIDHVVELMVNPFGNYLMQKLLEACSEEQRMRILFELTADPLDLVRISLNSHGTRAVQKLIETLKTPQEKTMVISAIQPGFLNLILDINGNHVVQRCLHSFTNEENQFIFDAAATHCYDIAIHRHGCCVLQRCIAHSSGERRAKLIAEICAIGLLLAQNCFGNYVVQYILEEKDPAGTAALVSQFEGNYAQLSMAKFSSNVVEKCLKYFGEADRARIIYELLSVSPFEQLLQDPFANYVIQKALEFSKGSLRTALVEAIRPHSALRTSPYCKRIFSRSLPKK